MTDSFVFGNGESRSLFKIDVSKFKKFGVTIGCNAIYRDFRPDILVSTDCEMIAEIVASEYPKENKCYFRGWEPVDAAAARDMIDSMQDEFDEVIDVIGDHKMAVLMGRQDNLSRIGFSKELTSNLYVIGVDEQYDISDLTKIGCDILDADEHRQEATYEFSGPVAMDIASKFSERVFLFGFDMAGKSDGTINNIYKGTKNYYPKDSIENPKLPLSIEEMVDVVRRYPSIKYYCVGFQPDPMIVSKFPSNIQFIRYHDFVGILGRKEISDFQLDKGNKDAGINI